MKYFKTTVGSKSILFGAHCFFTHPWFVALAWWRLFGFPWDPRLWVAFFVHDLGYWGKPNMDGPEGEAHPELGGRIMGWLFDTNYGTLRFKAWRFWASIKWRWGAKVNHPTFDYNWKNFTLSQLRTKAWSQYL